jgi:hypothetical protein
MMMYFKLDERKLALAVLWNDFQSVERSIPSHIRLSIVNSTKKHTLLPASWTVRRRYFFDDEVG